MGVSVIKIKGKDIFIVDSHHEALLPWSYCRRNIDIAPDLMTFDYHVDLHEPFQKRTSTNGGPDLKLRNELINGLDYNNCDSVANAINNLCYDEQINTAIDAGIIDKAFVIAYDYSRYQYPESDESIEAWGHRSEYLSEIISDKESGLIETRHEDPSNSIVRRPLHFTNYAGDIYVPGWNFLVSDTGKTDVEPQDLYRDYVISDAFLKKILKYLSEMVPNRVDENGLKRKYVLDIDLDYFTTLQGIKLSRGDTNCFYKLIKEAEIITIAKEEQCVKECSGYKLRSKQVLEILLNHIDKAL